MTDNKKVPTKRTTRKRGSATKSSRADTAKRASSSTQSEAATAPRRLAVIPLHVRWRDLDAFNHVNNSSYLTYLEESRLQWLRSVPGEWFNEHSMPVMAAVELHYRKPITWPGEIDVELSCERMGNSSLTIGNRILARGDAGYVYADGDVVMVWVDPATGASVSLPKAIRDAVA